MYYHCRHLKHVEYGKVFPSPDPDPDFLPSYRWLGHYCGYRMERVLVLELGVYGAGTEYVQLLSPDAHRMFERADIMMDCIGIATGMLLCRRLEKPTAIDGGLD